MKVTVEEDPITELARLLEIDLLMMVMMMIIMMMMHTVIMIIMIMMTVCIHFSLC